MDAQPGGHKTGGWNAGFAVFGVVIDGMEVAERISMLPTVQRGGMSMVRSSLFLGCSHVITSFSCAASSCQVRYMKYLN